MSENFDKILGSGHKSHFLARCGTNEQPNSCLNLLVAGMSKGVRSATARFRTPEAIQSSSGCNFLARETRPIHQAQGVRAIMH
jgi:hypothetical protein